MDPESTSGGKPQDRAADTPGAAQPRQGSVAGPSRSVQGQEPTPEAHRKPHVRFSLGEGSDEDLGETPPSDPQDDSGPSKTLPAWPQPRGNADRSREKGKSPIRPGSEGGPIPAIRPPPEASAPSSGRWPGDSSSGNESVSEGEHQRRFVKFFSQTSAQERARNLARRVEKYSTTAAPTTSPAASGPPSPTGGAKPLPLPLDGIPLDTLTKKPARDDADTESDEEAPPTPRRASTSEAHHLVRLHSGKEHISGLQEQTSPPGPRSGQVTPTAERDPDGYVPPPRQYRPGVLSALLKLYGARGAYIGHVPSVSMDTPSHSRRGSGSEETPGEGPSPLWGASGSSGRMAPRPKHQKWYSKSREQSSSSLTGLLESAAMMATPGGGVAAESEPKPKRQGARRTPPGGKVGAALNRVSRPPLEDEIRITVHIAETLARQRYLTKLCRALMSYGAPTHRLEEYMKMTARVLEIEGQFLYFPGCMIISFDDATTHTTEVKLVRSAQGVDLGKLEDIHEIYKEVVHDVIGVEEATQRLDEVMRRKQKHHRWLLVLVYGLASATVGPFAFEANLIDMPMAFLLGSLLGVLQLIVAPKSDLYSNVFEISAAVLTSFLARAIGSAFGGKIFCFSALAQSAIALILPGYTVLCGSLELQSKNLVAGSVRMVYAIIYSLFLGFGITIGTAIYGLIDVNATSSTSCRNQVPEYYRFLFVPAFTLCLTVINQAKWKQSPVMILIAFAGYIVNFFSSKRFPSNAQISNTLGALAVGVLGNLYSRIGHGVAAAALLPAIFVQVPSGLAASGSLVSGVRSANEIVGGTGHNTTLSNGTGELPKTTISNGTDSSPLNSVVFNVGYSMIQVAIGITVGLFLSALIIYPLGKRRSGLFSF